jgi:UDPglucose 6-dehydrogenase/GDP-mannose 6-dehydrogenase
MIKYASNALLATMISFANEIGNLCSATGGVDVVDVMRGVHLSSYITPRSAKGERVEAPIASFLGAGCGFGGSCLPKDVRALISEGSRRGQPMRMLNAVIETNDAQPDEVMRLAEEAAGDLHDRRVTVLGLAFKPATDVVRESPAIPIISRLLDRGAKVTVHDPLVTTLPEVLQGAGVDLDSDLEGTLEQAEVVILVTRWDTYSDVPALLARLREPPVLVDGRRMIDKTSVLQYAGVGL